MPWSRRPPDPGRSLVLTRPSGVGSRRRGSSPPGQGGRHARAAHLRRQPHRPHLLPARSLVVAGAGQVEAARAARRGAATTACHWFVDAQDRGMWNGVGPGLPPYTKGIVRPHRRDEGRAASSGTPAAAPSRGRPRPSCGWPISTATGSTQEIIYGCLMINDLIDDARPARLGQRDLQRLGRRLRQALRSRTASSRSPSSPTTIPHAAAAEVRRCAKMGLQGRRSRLQAHEPAALPSRLVPAVGGGGRVPLPDLLPLDRLQGAARARHAGDGEGVHASSGGWCARRCSSSTPWRCWSRCSPPAPARSIPDFNFVLGESGVTWLPYVFDRLDTEYDDRARAPRLQA